MCERNGASHRSHRVNIAPAKPAASALPLTNPATRNIRCDKALAESQGLVTGAFREPCVSFGRKLNPIASSLTAGGQDLSCRPSFLPITARYVVSFNWYRFGTRWTGSRHDRSSRKSFRNTQSLARPNNPNHGSADLPAGGRWQSGDRSRCAAARVPAWRVPAWRVAAWRADRSGGRWLRYDCGCCRTGLRFGRRV